MSVGRAIGLTVEMAILVSLFLMFLRLGKVRASKLEKIAGEHEGSPTWSDERWRHLNKRAFAEDERLRRLSFRGSYLLIGGFFATLVALIGGVTQIPGAALLIVGLATQIAALCYWVLALRLLTSAVNRLDQSNG
jgi:hypothetical protein